MRVASFAISPTVLYAPAAPVPYRTWPYGSATVCCCAGSSSPAARCYGRTEACPCRRHHTHHNQMRQTTNGAGRKAQCREAPEQLHRPKASIHLPTRVIAFLFLGFELTACMRMYAAVSTDYSSAIRVVALGSSVPTCEQQPGILL